MPTWSFFQISLVKSGCCWRILALRLPTSLVSLVECRSKDQGLEVENSLMAGDPGVLKQRRAVRKVVRFIMLRKGVMFQERCAIWKSCKLVIACSCCVTLMRETHHKPPGNCGCTIHFWDGGGVVLRLLQHGIPFGGLGTLGTLATCDVCAGDAQDLPRCTYQMLIIVRSLTFFYLQTVYIYIYICIHLCVYMCVYIWYIYVYICMYIYVNIYICIYMYVYTCIYIHVYL